MHTRRFAVVFAWTMFISFLVISETQAHTPQGNAGASFKGILPQEEFVIEKTGVVALRHIAQARTDIYHKSWASARREAKEANLLFDSIRDDLSTAVAKNLIAIARKHLEYEPAAKVERDLTSIFSALDRIETYVPTDKARRHLEQAREYLRKEDKQGADRELSRASRTLVVIQVELPILGAEKYIARAQGYLTQKNGQGADKALQAAERVIGPLTLGVESPLFSARNSFWLAVKNYSAARRAEARTYIEQARTYLENAKKAGSAKEREEASKLSRGMDELEKKVESGSKDAESALRSAWERSEALAERSAEYLVIRLLGTESDLSGENNLIEAKLHVSYAETYQLTAREPDKVAKELAEADSYLKKAQQGGLADKATRKKLGTMESAVLSLKANPEQRDPSVQERYESIKEQLSELIKKL